MSLSLTPTSTLSLWRTGVEGIFISSPHSSGWRISIPPAAQYEKGGGRREYLEITKEYKRECFGAPPLVRRVEFLLLSGTRRGEFALCCIAHTGPTLLSSLYNSREKKRVSLTSVRFPSLSPLTPSYGLPPPLPIRLKVGLLHFLPPFSSGGGSFRKKD